MDAQSRILQAIHADYTWHFVSYPQNKFSVANTHSFYNGHAFIEDLLTEPTNTLEYEAYRLATIEGVTTHHQLIFKIPDELYDFTRTYQLKERHLGDFSDYYDEERKEPKVASLLFVMRNRLYLNFEYVGDRLFTTL